MGKSSFEIPGTAKYSNRFQVLFHGGECSAAIWDPPAGVSVFPSLSLQAAKTGRSMRSSSADAVIFPAFIGYLLCGNG